MSGKTLEAIKFSKESVSLQLLDQLKLPYTTSYVDIKSIEDAFQAIKLMQVRGAPAIAITGAFAITVDTANYIKSNAGSKTIKDLIADIDYLVTSRPTAVNLSNACDEIKDLLRKTFSESDLVDQKTLDTLFKYSVALHEDDLRNNYKIGENGLNYIVKTLRGQNFTGPFSIMTVCNTGSLATSGHGTALGIIRSVHSKLSKSESKEQFWFEHAYPLETRPYNQGAKLTTYELQYEEIPFTLICDNMVTSLISSLRSKKAVKGSIAPVKFIIAGADRIVKNGDSANKIGTYQLAAIANHFNTYQAKNEDDKITFIIAAPNTTIDHKTASGEGIVIEERPSDELTTLKGPSLDAQGNVGEKITIGVATPGIEVWNPAFDVTPHDLIDSIVTEDRAITKEDGSFTL
ncbi:hypothetical protein JCM33374_g3913 [Metschnikowia sp. JCM 33374]|nr:hypothetical protein JCM33374_g3913 [Metschnikowia sp. JCM 33374]